MIVRTENNEIYSSNVLRFTVLQGKKKKKTENPVTTLVRRFHNSTGRTGFFIKRTKIGQVRRGIQYVFSKFNPADFALLKRRVIYLYIFSACVGK